MDLPIRYSAENILFNLSNIQGRDSPSLKLCCLSFQLVTLKYSVAQMCTREDTLARYLGTPSFDVTRVTTISQQYK